jgi:hypothetical protein
MGSNWLVWTLALGMTRAAAQPVVVDTITAMQPWPPHERFTFPHFAIPERPQLAERINRDLCIDFLEMDPDTATGSIFQTVWGDTAHGFPQQLFSLSWTSGQLLPEVLSVTLSGEGCGAYCEGFTVHYVYDLRDGSRLRYDSLFTTDGLKAVDDTLRKHWQAAVGAQLRLIQDSSRAPGLAADDRERWAEELELYRQCLAERSGLRPYVADMEPLARALRVWVAQCSAHYNRNVDDLGEVSMELPYAWLGPYLRTEALSLFRP